MTQDLDALPLPSFVKTSPERIHLVIGDNLEDGDEFNDLDEVTWCQDKQYDTDIEYVRADVVSEIVAAELRKAQEGREPVGEVVIRTYQAALGPVELATATLFTALPDGTKLYTSPPPKSDEPIPVTDDASATAYLEWALWKFIDMAGACPSAKVDPRIWAHVMVYAPKSDEATTTGTQPTNSAAGNGCCL